MRLSANTIIHRLSLRIGPIATAIAATVMKHARYGDVHPHAVLPFVVAHAGGINKEGMQFFRMCRDAADSKLSTRASMINKAAFRSLQWRLAAVEGALH